jgi:hypothetical protein
MSTVSRDVMRAVLEVRDHRHNETHAALVGLFQCLAAELVDVGAIRPGRLAERLEVALDGITEEVHGDAARDMVVHVATWLRSMSTELPAGHPPRWSVPPMQLPVDAHDR